MKILEKSLFVYFVESFLALPYEMRKDMIQTAKGESDRDPLEYMFEKTYNRDQVDLSWVELFEVLDAYNKRFEHETLK